MLSFIILLRVSIISLLRLKSTLTLRKTMKKVIAITGTIEITVIASFQFMVISNTDVPMMTKNDEIIVTNAWETNILIESVSEVRLVNNFEGLDFRINV